MIGENSDRLDRILGIPEKTPQEHLGCPWGIPIYSKKQSWSEIQQDVRNNPEKYEKPLEGFLEKLRIFAEICAREHNVEEEKVIDSAMEKSKEYFYADGKPKFTVTKRETNDERIMAWDFEWIAAGDKTPLATTKTNEKDYIKAMPATAILVKDGRLTDDEEGLYHLDEVIEILEIPGEIEESTEALYMAAPWCIVSGTLGMENEDSIHTEIAFVVNTLEIAFDICWDYLCWERTSTPDGFSENFGPLSLTDDERRFDRDKTTHEITELKDGEIRIGSRVGIEDEDGDWYGKVVEFDDDVEEVIVKREDDDEEYVVSWDSLFLDD